MRFQELLRPAEQAPVPDEIKDRRRPERNDQVSPHLIPLLRNPATMDVPALLPVEIDAPPLGEDQAFIKGIIFALALSVPLWAGIIAVGWAVLR
jgi:hypothetical protein